MAAINTRMPLPTSRTIHILYALLLLFSLNISLLILRTLATHKNNPDVELYTDFNVRFPRDQFKTLESAAEAFGCGYIGNGTLEVDAEQEKCKRRVLRAAVVMDKSRALARCGFREEYEAAIRGTPLQPLQRYNQSCWITSLPYRSGSRSRKSNSSGFWRGMTGRLRCMPGMLVLGSGRSGVTDLGEALSHHPQLYGPSHYGGQAWVDSDLPDDLEETCTSFSGYLDQYDVTADHLRRLNARNHGNKHNNSSDKQNSIIYGVAPRYIQGRVRGDPTLSISNHTLNHLPHTLKLVSPHLKLIFVLRNPIKRMFSDFCSGYSWSTHGRDMAMAFDTVVREAIIIWKQCVRQYSVPRCVHDLPLVANYKHKSGLSVLLGSLYAIYMTNWMEVFPASQIMIIKSDDYFRNRAQTLNSVTRFLKIQPFSTAALKDITRKPPINQGPWRNSVDMWDKTRRLVQKFFEAYNRDLATLVKDGRYLWR